LPPAPPPEPAAARTERKKRQRGKWWGGNADPGDSARLLAFSEGVFSIAIHLLILEVRIDEIAGEPSVARLRHAVTAMVSYANFLERSA
jgi:hypothetical protein